MTDRILGGCRAFLSPRMMLLAAFLLATADPAAAYVDPISGSVIFQVLAAGVLGALLTIRHWFASARAAARSLWLRLRRM